MALVEILARYSAGETRWAPLWIPLDIYQTPHHSNWHPVSVSYVKHPVLSLSCIGITMPGLLYPCLTPHPPLKAVRRIFHGSHNFRVFVLWTPHSGAFTVYASESPSKAPDLSHLTANFVSASQQTDFNGAFMAMVYYLIPAVNVKGVSPSVPLVSLFFNSILTLWWCFDI